LKPTAHSVWPKHQRQLSTTHNVGFGLYCPPCWIPLFILQQTAPDVLSQSTRATVAENSGVHWVQVACVRLVETIAVAYRCETKVGGTCPQLAHQAQLAVEQVGEVERYCSSGKGSLSKVAVCESDYHSAGAENNSNIHQ